MKKSYFTFIFCLIFLLMCSLSVSASNLKDWDDINNKLNADNTGLEQGKLALTNDILKLFYADPVEFVHTIADVDSFPNRDKVISYIQYANWNGGCDAEEYRTAVRNLLALTWNDDEKPTVYQLAWAANVSTLIADPPTAEDYALLLDMKLYADGAFSTHCGYIMYECCLADPVGFLRAMALTDQTHWEQYAFSTAFEALKPKELLDTLTKCKESLTDANQIACADMIITETSKYIHTDQTTPADPDSANPQTAESHMVGCMSVVLVLAGIGNVVTIGLSIRKKHW